MNAAPGHIPVLLAEVLALLAPRAGAHYLDGTFGGGGHAAAILAAADCALVGLDRDADAIARGSALAARHPGRLTLVEARFGDMAAALPPGMALDGVLLDLGVSSFQIDDPARGFSFRGDGPLDMRMGRTGRTAADLVATAAEAELAGVLRDLGEERYARRIAAAIVAARTEAPITTTSHLATIIRAAAPRDPSGMDTATRSFQALRIAVNEELAEVERGLDAALGLLAPGGRLIVIAFHSLEDRIVKHRFAAAAGRGAGASRHDPAALAARIAPPPAWTLMTPRAVRPGPDEVAANPRARSARLRALERTAPAGRVAA